MRKNHRFDCESEDTPPETENPAFPGCLGNYVALKIFFVAAMVMTLCQVIHFSYLVGFGNESARISDEEEGLHSSELYGKISLEELKKRYSEAQTFAKAMKKAPEGLQAKYEPTKDAREKLSSLSEEIERRHRAKIAMEFTFYHWLAGIVLYSLGLVFHRVHRLILALALLIAGFGSMLVSLEPDRGYLITRQAWLNGPSFRLLLACLTLGLLLTGVRLCLRNSVDCPEDADNEATER